MGSEKPDDEAKILAVLRDEGRCLCGFGAHIHSYSH